MFTLAQISKQRCQITILWIHIVPRIVIWHLFWGWFEPVKNFLRLLKLTLDFIFIPLISGSLCYFGSIISLSVKKVMDHLRLRTNILHHTAQLISLLCLYSTFAGPSEPGGHGPAMAPSLFWSSLPQSGGQIKPPTLLYGPQIFKHSYAPVM